MSLEGLRAWIGEVERKLGKRTRVFLALAVIAIGLGGAAIYLAIDARESSVSEADVQELQEELEARIGTGSSGTAGTEVSQLEAELNTLKAEVSELKGEGESPKGDGTSNGSGSDTPPDEADGGTSSGPGGASPGAEVPGGGVSKARIQGLLEQAKKQNAEAEEDQAGK